MWAQLIKMRLKADSDADVPALFEQFQAIEQSGSGLIRTTLMHSQNDPSEFYVMVVFESEEHARTRENDPRRQEAMKPAGDDGGDVRRATRVRRPHRRRRHGAVAPKAA